MSRQADIIKRMADKEIMIHLYLTQIMLLLVSIILAFFLFEDVESFISMWSFHPSIFYIGGSIAIGVIVVDLLLERWLPKEMLDDGGINKRMFEKLNIIHILFVCFLISFTEELLFRGILQTHFGLYIASIVFALLHIRYLYKWVLLLSVVVLSFLLGIVFENTGNLWVTIFAHFMIDAVFALKLKIEYIKSLRK
ncbi:CPBP family intramembrane metalloprotease [Bacillus sp. PS06]|nr:CPBP family intramembrane metalloprotease [Bacillus sp. PS06]